MKFGVGERSDDGDEVIATYNVYASPSLQHQLHIFQFPLRRKMRPYEANDVRLFTTDGLERAQDDTIQSSKPATPGQGDATPAPILRPSSRLTMHCRIDTFGSSSFVEPQQQQQQQADDALGKGGQQRRHSYEYALQSHPFQPRCDYVVGFIVDGAIHITPVATIQQFTPIVKPATSDTMHRVGDAFVSAPSMPILPGLAISDRINREMLRQRSVMLNTDAATAKELQYFPIDSVESMAMRRRLWSPTYEAAATLAHAVSGPRRNARTEDSLFPPELLISGGISGGEDAATAGSLLRRYADRHSVMNQVVVLLQRCQVLSFVEMRKLVVPPDQTLALSSPTSRQQQHQERLMDEQLLEALRDTAVWIHGVWVSKRSACFKGTIAALREVILLHFYESPDGAISRAQLNKLFNSTAHRRTVKEVLMSMATLNSSELEPGKRVWRLWQVPAEAALREAMVHASQNAYPQELEFQRMQWGKLKPYIMAHLKAINAGQSVVRLHLAARRHEVGSDVANITGATAAAAAAATVAPASFKDEEIAPIVAYIRRLFLEHGVVNKQRAKELVMKAKQQHYPEATNPMLSVALQRCVQPFTNATWVLKTLGEPDVDRHRPMILEAALELVNFENRAFNALLEEKLRRRPTSESGEGLSSEDLQKVVPRVLAEVAVYKQHERLWHLKSGNVVAE
ncbi:hypothetical protein DQ04_02241030 [Trypanosoma grayi]|uniref:hypothetical protein n=1 Tax=Trypanosoma grayi TaxID=71804 RepID=UPI0004F4107B|nr:hypothetical protein DQ04_02241030 [Trypanosoma grayi]KEG11825.1 hypothetical protein DQ04_02241030 [Trypanosoma grayi]